MPLRRLLKAVSLLSLLAVASVQGREPVALARLGHVHDVAVAANGAIYLAAHDGVYVVHGTEGLRITQGHFQTLAWGDDRLLGSGSGPDRQRVRLAAIDPATGAETSIGESAPQAFDLLAAEQKQHLYGIKDAGVFLYSAVDKGWQRTGSVPAKPIDLAVTADHPDRLYLSTVKGLFVSNDRGHSWKDATPYPEMSTAVTARNGRVYTFVRGIGLLRTFDESSRWSLVGNAFGQELPIRLATVDAKRIYAVTNYGKLFASVDAGETWRRLDRPQHAATPAVSRGRALYEKDCQSCHGVSGVGEAPRFMASGSQELAPALDETMHAWHHTDENLASIIKNGTSGRMPAWGDTLTDRQVADLISYIKSLWGERELACQGPAHMRLECRR